MKHLERNMTTIYYALYLGNKDIRDENGFLTGESCPRYSTPLPLRINVSAAKGTTEAELFGIDADYTKTLVTCDLSCPLREDSVLWLGQPPSEPYNYVVRRVARSLNSVMYAVKEVKAGG